MTNDPFYDREQAKYENPVASREHLLSILKENNAPMSFMDICQAAGAKDEMSRIALQTRLRAMERAGQVVFTKHKKYAVGENSSLITGRVIGHRDGFGFLRVEGRPQDLFISPSQMQLLIHDDLIEVKEGAVDRRGRTEAQLVRILEPRAEPIVGRYFLEQNMAIVIPDDSRLPFEIVIPAEHRLQAKMGQVVVVELMQRPRRRVNAIGKIIEVLGEHMAPGMEIEMALRTFDIPHVWPDAVERQVAGLSDEVPEEAKAQRIDLRALPLITIDGEDARDFDDAVYCRPLPEGGFTLYVAIADVSYYVRVGTALDHEAQKRGTSVYFPDQVVPMLPEALSNGLCSLNPNVDRLCMVCEMNISPAGHVDSYRFYEAVMNSHARMTYNKVWQILQGEETLRQRYAAQVQDIEHLYALYKVLQNARRQRGAIEFETQETKFVFNAHRKIDNIVPLVRNDAHKLIEECMIAANVCAANFVLSNKSNALFRVHDKPDADRLTSLTAYLREIGVSHRVTENSPPSDFTDVLLKTAERLDNELIQTMLLRCMKQAIYSPDNIGHFGLALDAYAHFTSPIRRYPDLVVHRAIKAVIKETQSDATPAGAKKYTKEEVEQLGEQCSMTERRADDATRDVADWLKCEFMLDHIGNEYQGVVSSVTNFGLFVRLVDYHIDGLVHITSLGNDYYRYDEVKQCLVGERHSNSFRLGDRLQVKVAAVNLDDRKIDLVLAGTSFNVEKPRRKSMPEKKSDAAKKSKQRAPKPAKKVVKPKAKKRKK